jgi:hypothetical protein
MPEIPDTTLVDLHRVSRSPLRVSQLDGAAWRVPDEGRPEPLGPGDELGVGDTIAVAEGGVLEAGPLLLRGGLRGRTHRLVEPSAFRASPSRADVPRLLLQLTQIQEQMGHLGEDPLAVRGGPETPFERCASADFARSNLVLSAARELPEALARAQGAVPLFVNEETAFVAMVEVSVTKLQVVMEALERPVTPHMVETPVLEELLERVYGLGM